MKNLDMLEQLYAEFELLGKEEKEKKLKRKEIKEQMIELMNEDGVDEVIINGLDTTPIQLTITYPEREVLNKKRLAEAVGVKQQDLSKPQTWIQLTVDGKITEEMIQEFTEVEERMQFSANEYEERDEND